MNEFRSVDRSSTDSAISYLYKGISYAGRIGDLSNDGCTLAMSGIIPGVGDAIELTLMEDLEVAGKVEWIVDDIATIKFNLPVIDAVVRYFDLPHASPAEADVTTDSFGRPLPPLGKDFLRR